MLSNEQLFREYEYLANIYAKKVFNESHIGYSKDDIAQEFRIKLFEVILAYRRSIVRRIKNERIHPVPLPIYIKGSLANFVKDFIKKIKKDESLFTYSNVNVQLDYAVLNKNFNKIDFSENVFEINGLDITKPLSGLKKVAFVMHLKGNNLTEIEKKLGNHLDVKKVIKDQKKFLQKNIELFQLENTEELFVTKYQED